MGLFREESYPFRPSNVVNMQTVQGKGGVPRPLSRHGSAGSYARNASRQYATQPRLSATAAQFVQATQLQAGSLVRIALPNKETGRIEFGDIFTKVESKMFPGYKKLNYKALGYVAAVLRDGYSVQLFNSKEERFAFSNVRSLDTEGAEAVVRETTELCSILDTVVIDLEKGECDIQKYFKRTGGLMVKLSFLGEDISKYTQGTEIRVTDIAIHPRDFSKTRVEKVRHLHKLDKSARADLEAFLEHMMKTGFNPRGPPKYPVRDCYATHLRWKKENPRDHRSPDAMFISFNARLDPQAAIEYLRHGIRWKNRRYQVERPMTKTAKFVSRNPLTVTVQSLIAAPTVEEQEEGVSRLSITGEVLPGDFKLSRVSDVSQDAIPKPLTLTNNLSGASVCSSIVVEPPMEIESPIMSPRTSVNHLQLQSWASINSQAPSDYGPTLEAIRQAEDEEAESGDDLGDMEAAPRKPLKMRNWASYNESDTLCPEELPAMPNLNYPQLPDYRSSLGKVGSKPNSPGIYKDHSLRKPLNLSNDNSLESLRPPKKLSNDNSLESVKEETKEELISASPSDKDE